MTRRSRLLIAVAGVGLQVLLVLLTHPTDPPLWRSALTAVFTVAGFFTFAVVALSALRDNARNTRHLTGARTTTDPFANDWNHYR